MNSSVPVIEPSELPKHEQLHVLTLTAFYPTDRDDASGCFVAEPLVALADRKVRNTIFAAEPIYRSRSHASLFAPPAQWIRYFALPGAIGLSTAGAFLYARIVGRVRDLHRKQPIHLIHAHAPLPSGHAAMLLNRELGIPYVVSVHGLDAFSTVQVSGKSGEWCRNISQRVFRNAARVICVSERVREQVLEGANCRTSVVYNGVNPDLFTPDAAEPDSPAILSVGNLIPIKGHDILIRALACLPPEFPSLQCEIIGEGPELGRLQSLAKELRIVDRVRFLGRQSRAQVAEAMRRCTLLVLPSRYEALGCVYLEAMSAGKPALACRGQGIAEVIQHGRNGLLVSPDNHRELMLAISTLLREKVLRRQIGIAARYTVLNGFTLAQQAEDLLRVYGECAR